MCLLGWKANLPIQGDPYFFIESPVLLLLCGAILGMGIHNVLVRLLHNDTSRLQIPFPCESRLSIGPNKKASFYLTFFSVGLPISARYTFFLFGELNQFTS